MFYHLNKFVVSFKCCLLNKSNYFYINNTKFILSILQLCKLINVIDSYRIYLSKILVKINITYIKDIILASSSSCINYISYSKIIINSNKVLVLSTNKGVITDSKSKEIFVGGLMLFYIIYA